MTRRSLLLTLAGLALALSAPLAGCSTSTKMTEQEKANFKGGPMPPGYVDPSLRAPQAPAPARR